MTHGLLVGISGQQVGDRKEEEQRRVGKGKVEREKVVFYIWWSQNTGGE